tara:strand:+ start:314 stop:616 length:303 start_codon:yes stop_codon:yes gene_type:complete
MALWIQADGTETRVILSNGSSSDKMFELQKYVDGYYTPIYLSDGKIMLVNEEGILRALPYNSKATRLATSKSNLTPSAINRLETYHILGDVLIVSNYEFN